jgi:hypothetical protein
MSAQEKEGVDGFRAPEKYNFRFIGFDSDIDDPENDRRSYYRVYVDKAEEGRTTIGLESQEKVFEASLPPNRHLITIEKWVLDLKTGRYLKLNNIDQPKPNFFYFDLPEKRIVIVKKRTDRNGSAEYMVDFER